MYGFARRLGLLALGAYSLTLLGSLLPLSAPTPLRPTNTHTRPQAKTFGFALNVHHTDQLDLYLQAINEQAQLGCNSLLVLTPAFQRDGAAADISIQVGPGRGPARHQLLVLLEHARLRGMTTCLMPVVLFTQPRGNEWRGKISPEDWDAWWESYADMLRYFINIANEAGVDALAVGSELLSTERDTQRWSDLIAEVRRHYGGRLVYSTNWDHYHTPQFWSHLDAIGISGYWDLTAGAPKAGPTDEQLQQRWVQIREKLLAFSQTQQRPVLLMELGYPSLPWALKSPWNYVAETDVPADHQAQARGYQSFLRAFTHDLTSADGPLAGVYFYAWDPYHRGGPRDTGYGVRGKPALTLVQQWLKDHSLPTEP